MKNILMVTLLLAANYFASDMLIFKNQSGSQRSPASSVERIKNNSSAGKIWSFKYKDLSKQSFSIKKEAKSYEEAYKSASKECFKILTDGKYPGEEKGLDIIDICANPKS